MAVPPEVRIPLENEPMMGLYQPALGESLDDIPEAHTLVFHGLAQVGNCDSYYLITYGGIYYCEKERIGRFKKQYASRYFDLEQVESIQVDVRRDLKSAYVRFYGVDKMLLCMWFKDYLSFFQSMSAEGEAWRFANRYST